MSRNVGTGAAEEKKNDSINQETILYKNVCIKIIGPRF